MDTSPARPFEVTNRMVFAIAVPMTLAYLTTPLLGIVDTGVVGQFGDPALIGGVAVGAIVFDVIFTTFNFLRAGTTGFVAQALGRGDETEQQAVFWRAALLAVALGLLVLAFSVPIREAGLALMAPDAAVRDAASTYVAIRILAAPLTLINYAVLGLLLGQGRSMAGLALQSLINGLNMALSLWLGLGLGWSIEGVAWGTVAGEAAGVVFGLLWVVRSFDAAHRPDRNRVLDRASFIRLLAVNRDIMIRSFALLAAFALFTRLGAGFGAVPLAANAILMNFFMIAGYYLDGFAVAAEQIVGRAIGARWRPAFDRAVRLTALWGFGLAAITTVAVLVFGTAWIDLMTTAPEVRAAARHYLIWSALTAVAGVLAFQMDGVYIGASWSRDMRNMMLMSLAIYAACIALAVPLLGNHGLWLSLNVFLAARGATLLALLPRRAADAFSPADPSPPIP